jgi:hypothetical protein
MICLNLKVVFSSQLHCFGWCGVGDKPSSSEKQKAKQTNKTLRHNKISESSAFHCWQNNKIKCNPKLFQFLRKKQQLFPFGGSGRVL